MALTLAGAELCERRARLRIGEYGDPFTCLRHGRGDVLINWLAVDEPGLSIGLVIAYYDRVLAVAPGHRLAKLESVPLEELGEVARFQGPRPAGGPAEEVPNTPGGRSGPAAKRAAT